MYWVIFVAVLFVVLAVVVVGLLMRVRSELRGMSPLPTGRITGDVFAVRDGHVNFYLVKDGDRYVAIDCGQHTEVVERELRSLGVDGNAVSAILLTHTDRDHVGALGLFIRATVYVPLAEEVLLDGTTHRVFIFNNKISRPYTSIRDREEMTVGGTTVLSILTPGHTPGSTCYLVNGKYLFTGDTIGLRNGEAGIFSRLFNMDAPRQAESLATIARLPGVETIFTAHHGTNDNYQAAFATVNP
jgi:glyoxylase-like metal-dependent hydrolase (beta-lactamase superfamily II)